MSSSAVVSSAINSARQKCGSPEGVYCTVLVKLLAKFLKLLLPGSLAETFFFPFFHRNGLPSEKKIEPFLIVLFIFNDLFSFNPSGNLRAFCDLVPIGVND